MGIIAWMGENECGVNVEWRQGRSGSGRVSPGPTSNAIILYLPVR